MHFAGFIIAALCNFAAAVPASIPHSGEHLYNISPSPTNFTPAVYSSFDIHNNILANWPSDLIITSDKLHQYLNDHSGEDFHVYLSDKEEFITPHATTNKSLDARTGCIGSYTSQKVLSSQSFWGPWDPVSTCYYNSDNSASSTLTLTYSESIGITENFSFSPTIIEKLLSASLGFSVTETWTTANAYACTVAASGVAQIWGRHVMGWASIQTTESFCSGQIISSTGWALAPQNSPSTYGCSGSIYVDCNNW